MKSVECRVERVELEFKVWSVEWRLKNVHNQVYLPSVQCGMLSVQCVLYSVQCVVSSIQCTVYIVQYTVYLTQEGKSCL